MLEELAKHDEKWRQIALMITNGCKVTADDIVNEMYLRRYDNDRGQPITEYYIILTMKSIFLNQKKTNKIINVEEVRDILQNDEYEITDEDREVLNRYNNLSFTEKELIELSYDYSLREIQKKFGINYGYAHSVITQARKKVLQTRINEYNNKRLKHRKMKQIKLGDAVEKIAKFFWIKQFIKTMGVDCGCDKRKEALNNLPLFFKKKLKPRCFTKEELQEYAEFVIERKFEPTGLHKGYMDISNKWAKFVIEMHESIFAFKTSINCFTCEGSARTLMGMINELDIVYLNNIPEQKKVARKKKEEVE